MPAESSNRPRERFGLGWWVWIPAAILAYLLSSGPAIWIYERSNSTRVQNILEVVYAPVEWAAQLPVIGRAIDSYAEWWRDRSEK